MCCIHLKHNILLNINCGSMEFVWWNNFHFHWRTLHLQFYNFTRKKTLKCCIHVNWVKWVEMGIKVYTNMFVLNIMCFRYMTSDYIDFLPEGKTFRHWRNIQMLFLCEYFLRSDQKGGQGARKVTCCAEHELWWYGMCFTNWLPQLEHTSWNFIQNVVFMWSQ